MENRLKHFREEKGWTQSKLSEKTGISRTTIIALESGKAQVSKTDTLVKIADALGKSVSEVFFAQ